MKQKTTWSAAFLLLGMAGVAQPQTEASPASETRHAGEEAPSGLVGWHEVKPGETLEGITTLYLGSPSAWQENWRLNPDIADPNHLAPGQRIRVILGRRSAEITAIAKDVEEKPYPEPWVPAQLGDRLKERDGVRTRAQSSAELAFEDGSRLRVFEQSVVFLRDTGTRLEGVSRKSLEIQQGQADIEAQPAAVAPSDIEIFIEGARARARPGRDDPSLARARRNAEGTAQVMVFRGDGQVEAAGSTVAIAAGMGTQVPKDGRPTPPERLLPAPKPWRPVAGARLDHANPKLSWDPVDGAVAYAVDVCRDEACAEIVARLTDLTEPQAIPELLPLGDLYWRVNAVSASGLDGFMSPPRAMSVRSLWRKPHPPRRRVAPVTGPGS